MADPEATIHNERTKLTATYVNGAAIAVLAIGGLAPLFSVFGSTLAQSLWIVTIQLAACLVISAVLHLIARWFLGRLKP